jgi:nitrogen fixation/metabolism regulation signal transduction histidine kinase
VAATLALTWRLLEHSISLNPGRELDASSRALEAAGRALYQTTCEALRTQVEAGRQTPSKIYPGSDAAQWPPEVREVVESGEPALFHLAGEQRNRVDYFVRAGAGVVVYSKVIAGPGMQAFSDEFVRARALVERSNAHNLRRGFTLTLIVIAAAVWAVSFIAVVYLSRRISRPMEELTSGLRRLADGDLHARLEPNGTEEVAAAMRAFNHTASQLRESQEKLVHVTRLSSWQTLARKMAHEVKNSLTPIRLMVEEIVARRADRDEGFFEQAAQIVVDEIGTLERRVRAFSEFSSEPPVQVRDVDVNAMLEERMALLKTAHPGIICDTRLSRLPVHARVDPDLVKGVFTNLLDNAAYAAGPGGVVLGKTFNENGKVGVEIHDSGPGLSDQARSSLFEPTISFRKSGMGLGLSIAKRSAVLSGGDILLIDGELGGAAFRVLLPSGAPDQAAAVESSEEKDAIASSTRSR